jgi:hypothetical protein
MDRDAGLFPNKHPQIYLHQVLIVAVVPPLSIFYTFRVGGY